MSLAKTFDLSIETVPYTELPPTADRVKGLVDKMIVSDNFDFTGYWLYNDPEASPIVQAYIDLYNKLVEKANFKILK